MKNFGTLFGYEMKKLLTRKLSWAVVLVLTGFCVFAVVRKGNVGSDFIIPVFDEEGNETGETRTISGEEIYATYLKTEGALDGRVMDGAFFQEMLESVPPFKGELDSDVYFWTQDATWQRPYSIVTGLFDDPRGVTAEEFYARQLELTREHLENYGDSRTSEGTLSQGEIDYWMEQAEKIQKPFVFVRPWRGFTSLTDFFYVLLGLLPIAAAVCVCTPFSEDRRSRVDALVFSARNSRAPLYLAKILAGASMSALAGVIIVGAVTAAHLAVWGTQGLDAVFQLSYITNPRPVAFWQVLLPMLVLLVLYTMLCGGVAMLTASITRSANVAHELRTPLATMQASVQVLRLDETPTPEDCLQMLDAARLRAVIDDLMRLCNEQDEFETSEVSLSALFSGIFSELAPKLEEKHIQTEIDCEQYPTVMGNEGLLYRAFFNLAENAAKYGRQGGKIQVTSSCEGNLGIIRVSDTGSGIPKEHLPHIFEPFYRVNRSCSRKLGGAGLGLSVVKTIIERHGWSIFVDSAVDVGTEFEIRLYKS